MSQEDINLLIIAGVEKNPVLYNKKHPNYYISEEKEKAFIKITNSLNVNLQNKLSYSDVKKRWENLRSSYTRSRNYNNSYYLSEPMKFLQGHISTQKTKKRKIDEPSTSYEELDDTDLTYEDVLECILPRNSQYKNQQSHMSTVQKSSDNQRLIPKTSIHGNIATPKVSANYQTKEGQIKDLEKDILQLLDETAKALTDISTVPTTTSSGNDVYFKAIQKALDELPEDQIFEGVCGIVDIIENFIK